MTQIDFYSGADNKLLTACRLTAKAVQQGLSVMIYTPDAECSEKLDNLLWTFSATGFVPHCQIENALAKVTPVTLSHQPEPLPHHEVQIGRASCRERV